MLRIVFLFSFFLAVDATAQIDTLKTDSTAAESDFTKAEPTEVHVDTVLYQREAGLEQYLSAGDTTDLEMNLYQNPTAALFKSALVPGWGQFGNRKYFKAVMFAGLSAWMISSAVRYRSEASDFKAQFESETDISARNNYYAQYIDSRDSRNKFTWYAGIIAFISMFDAYVDAHLSGFPDKERVQDISFDVTPDTDGGVKAAFYIKF